MEEHSLLLSVFIYLLCAVIAVPISKRLGLGSVLGYLAAGIVIGPWGLGLVHDGEHVLHFAEFGVVLLLFLIGLELNPSKLWKMRKPILGSGGSQVLISALCISAASLALGLAWRDAIVVGMALALSSTAIALQIMAEKNLMPTPVGQTGFSVLLFQDIAVIPMIALLPLLGTIQTNSTIPAWLSALEAIGAIIVIVAGGKYLLRPAFRFIAATKMREIFTAFTLLLVVGIAVLMDTVGLSMALGTFIAGVLLADSEYRHELETNIEPFKGLLLGLFFISVGMTVDFGLLFKQPLLILGLVLGLIVIKGLILYVIAKIYGLSLMDRPLFTIILSQGGEFAFVLLSTALGLKAIDSKVAAIVTVVVAISMLTTPLLLIIWERFGSTSSALQESMDVDVESENNPVIIAGFGRVGQIIGRVLVANNIGTTVLDHNPQHIERVRRFGFQVFYGDATRVDLLHTAGIMQAKILIITIDDQEQATELAKIVGQEFPHIKLVVRAWDLVHAFDLMKVGVENPFRETFGSSLNMVEEALKILGYGAFEAKKVTARFERHDIDGLQKMYQVDLEEDRVILAGNLRASLEDRIREDEHRDQVFDDQWG